MSMSPTVGQLRAVVAVAEARSFTRAAAALVIAQSSLSRAVAEVERSAGVDLFVRTTRSVETTPEGDVFVAMAREVLRAYDEGLTHFSGHLEGTAGVLRIAVLPSLAATLLPRVVLAFRRRRPGVRIEVADVLAGDVVESVRSGAVDLALTAAPPTAPGASTGGPTPDGMRFAPFATDTFRCIVARDHHLVAREVVSWHDLAQEAFVSFDPGSSVSAIVDATLAAQDVVPVRRLAARNIATVAGLCAASLGVTAAPAFVVPLMSFADLVTLPLASPTVRRHVGVLTDPRRAPTPAATTFVEVLRGLAAEGAPLPEGAEWTGHDRPAAT